MQSVTDWRSTQTDDDFADLDLAGFAQEFLRLNPDYCRKNFRMYMIYCCLNTFSQIIFVSISQLAGFIFTGRGTAGNSSTTQCTAFKANIYFNGWIPP